MPIKRKVTYIQPLQSTIELLSYLQITGRLDGVEIPDWATGGTSVEELMQALQYLGNGKWLDGAYPNYGSVEAADRWLFAFMDGRPVPDEEDVAAHVEAVKKGEIDEGEEIVFKEIDPPATESARVEAK